MFLYISESTPTPRQKHPLSKGFSPNTAEETPWALSHSFRLLQQGLEETEPEFTSQHLQGRDNLLEQGLTEQRLQKSALPPSNVQVAVSPVRTSSWSLQDYERTQISNWPLCTCFSIYE